MGKLRRKNRKPDELLLGENRLQRKQIKKLQQEIRRLQKEINYNQNKNGEPKYTIKKKDNNECTECGKGELVVFDLGIRKYTICQLCKDRKQI